MQQLGALILFFKPSNLNHWRQIAADGLQSGDSYQYIGNKIGGVEITLPVEKLSGLPGNIDRRALSIASAGQARVNGDLSDAWAT